MAGHGRPRGSPKVGGRVKGTPNKLTGELKSMILSAAERAGGEGGAVAYLAAQATENPTAFLALLGKLVPLTAEGETGSLIVNLVRFADPT
jgi:hypothetical protein